MRNLIKVAAIGGVATCLGACVTTSGFMSGGGTYRSATVTSVSASKFYYARSDVFEAAGEGPAKQQVEMAKRPSFGPFDLPATLQLLEGMAYDFFPRCGGAIAWNNGAKPVIQPSDNQIKLACP